MGRSYNYIQSFLRNVILLSSGNETPALVISCYVTITSSHKQWQHGRADVAIDTNSPRTRARTMRGDECHVRRPCYLTKLKNFS